MYVQQSQIKRTFTTRVLPQLNCMLGLCNRQHFGLLLSELSLIISLDYLLNMPIEFKP